VVEIVKYLLVDAANAGAIRGINSGVDDFHVSHAVNLDLSIAISLHK